MLQLVDRYIVKELLGPFIFGMTAFSAILAGSTILIPLMQEAAKYEIPVEQIIQLFIYQMPGLIVFTFPMSMLLATILAFGRLNTDLEILAFRSAGVSFFRLVGPVIMVGLFVSLLTIWFNESIVPQATHSAENLINIIKNKDEPTIKKNINITEYDNFKRPSRIINVQKVDEGQLKGVTVLEYEDGELVRTIKADTGRWDPNGGWEFYDGVMFNFLMMDRSKAIVIEFEKEFINIQVDPFKFTEREKDAEEMNTRELKERIELKKKTGEAFKDDLVRYHMKFAVPFASLIFSILGASMGLRPHRSSSAMGLGVSLIIILAYYVLLGIGLGFVHIAPAIFVAWMPNIVVGAVGLMMLRRISNQ